jgi:MarR family transcriptional regulator for hemolysin
MQLLTDAIVSEMSEDQCARDLLDVVPFIMQFIRTHLRGVQGQDLSVPQIRTLSFVNRNVRPSLSCTAYHLGLSLPGMSRLVDALVRKGLVNRTACPRDRRHIRLELTDKGRAALNLAWQATRVELAREVASLSPQQRGLISAAMEMVRPVFNPKVIEGLSD